jgi:hypothetical protein
MRLDSRVLEAFPQKSKEAGILEKVAPRYSCEPLHPKVEPARSSFELQTWRKLLPQHSLQILASKRERAPPWIGGEGSMHSCVCLILSHPP